MTCFGNQPAKTKTELISEKAKLIEEIDVLLSSMKDKSQQNQPNEISRGGVVYVQVADGRYVIKSELGLHNHLEENPSFYYEVKDGKAIETTERMCLSDSCYIGEKAKPNG